MRIDVGELGPFQRRDLRLLLVEGTATSFMDERANAGNSAAWQLGGTPFSVRANGAASLSPLPTVLPATGYTSLNFSIPVRIEIAALCAWQVVIVSRNGSYSQMIDDAFQVSSIPFITNIEGSIPGWKIRKAQGGGIFEIQSAKVACGGALNTWSGESLAQTGPHRSADFELLAPSFDLSFESTDTKRLQIPATQTRPQEFFFNVDPIGDFDNNLSCTFDRQPPGITLSFDAMPANKFDWPVKVMVTLASTVAPGPAPVTISCTGRGITKTAVLGLNII